MAETGRRIRAAARALPRVPQRLISDERLVAFVRRGEPAAFERLYDRHAPELLSFCFFILGSREDAEDAVQSTFASAHRALLRDDRAIEVRPWLFAIARNACFGIVRKRRPQESEQLARIAGEDMLARVERRERIRDLLAAMLELPERHRTALILAELHGHSQREIGQLLGVSPATVKSYIFQARSALTSERTAREADCHEIREELATARGAALLRGRLRRHLRACAGCREYADQVAHRRRDLGALLPLLPSLQLRRRVLDATAGKAGGAGAGAVAGCAGGAGAGVATTGVVELGGAGAKTLLAKALIAVTGLGAGAGAGTLAIGVASSQPVTPAAARLDVARASAPHAGSTVSPAAGESPRSASSPAVWPGVAVPVADQPRKAQSSAPNSRAVETAHGRMQSAGSGGAAEGAAAQAEASNGHGKANGHSAEHGNSAAAHAGGNGNAGGNSAEHAHGQGNGNGNGNAGGNGKGNNAGGNGHGEAQANGRGNGGGKANGAANGGAKGRAGSGGGAQGDGRGQEGVHGVHGNGSPAAGGPSASSGGAAPARGESHGKGIGATSSPAESPAAEPEPSQPAAEHGAGASAPAGEHGGQGGAHEPQGGSSRETQGHGVAKA